MSKLIPTPIVNKNGVATTVHKRSGNTSSAVSMNNVPPPTASGTNRSASRRTFADKKVTVSADGVLPHKGIILMNSDHFEDHIRHSGFSQYSWRRSEVEMTNGELYAYLRLGVGITEAVALKTIGVSPDQLPSDERFSSSLPGSLSRITRGSKEYPIENRDAIDGMLQAEIPALRAAKALESGLQDGHLNSGLGMKELVGVFAKYKYGVAIGDHRKVESSALVDGILSGDIPIELTKGNSRTTISRMEHEISRSKSQRKQVDEAREALGHDEFVRIANIGINKVHTDQPVYDTYRLMQEYGEGVLELSTPALADLWREDDGGPFGLDGARYLDEIAEYCALDKTDDFGDWQYQVQDRDRRVSDRRKVTMSGNDLLTLKDAGVSASDAYSLMMKRGMSLEQILVAVESNTPMSLAEGAL